MGLLIRIGEAHPRPNPTLEGEGIRVRNEARRVGVHESANPFPRLRGGGRLMGGRYSPPPDPPFEGEEIK